MPAGRSDLRRLPDGKPPGMPRWLPLAFLSPTLVLLVVYIVYPLIYSVINSFYDDRGEQFVGVRTTGSSSSHRP